MIFETLYNFLMIRCSISYMCHNYSPNTEYSVFVFLLIDMYNISRNVLYICINVSVAV